MQKKHLWIVVTVAALLAAGLVASVSYAYEQRAKVSHFQRQRSAICTHTMTELKALAQGVGENYGDVDAVLSQGVMEMCTGEINPSSWACWNTATDRAKCFTDHAAHWRSVFETHQHEWTSRAAASAP